MRLQDLIAKGFNESKRLRPGQYRVRCDSCKAVVVNNVPTHEPGCPNAVFECHGCGESIPARQRYCADCV